MSGAHHPSLRRGAADLIGGTWVEIPGDAVVSHNPAHPERVVWAGSPRVAHVDAAVRAAREALGVWARLPLERREGVLRRYQQVVKARQGEIADLICDETGKAMWEARGEASILASKVDITLERDESGGLRRVTGYRFDISPTRVGRCFFRPHGVMAVVGPFNFPAHLPNGHIVPALLMGNTVVLKPSDKTPGVGQLLGELFQEALEAEGFGGLGVVNVVQGAADVASSLVSHNDVDGILFTGSWPVGRRILEANLDRPGRIVALEMGGNNAAVVMDDADLRQAAIEIVRCAFNTTGQRCTCTRRAIIHERVAGRLIPAICKAASQLLVGDPREGIGGHPAFMGPIIRREAREAVLGWQAELARGGGEVLVESSEIDVGGSGGWYLTPSVVRVERFVADGVEPAATTAKAPGGTPEPHPSGASGGVRDAGCDMEVFGPLLRVCVVRSYEEAVEQANATKYGLAASIFTRSPEVAERFLHDAKAGCINVNNGTAGASSKLPFGGLGHSGNHRPAGSFSLDYCAYPVAGMVESGSAATLAEGMRFDDGWLA